MSHAESWKSKRLRSFLEKNWIRIFLFFLVLLFLLVIGLAGPHLPSPRYWEGWYLLRLPAGASLKESAAALSAAGILHEHNTPVSYADIPGGSSVTAADLNSFLPPGDSRRDPYLNNVHRFFYLGDSPLMYLSAAKSPAYWRRLVGETLPGAEFPDDAWTERLFSVAAFFLLALLTAAASVNRDRRWATLIAALPWGFYLLFADPWMIVPATLAYLFLPHLIRLRRGGQRVTAILGSLFAWSFAVLVMMGTRRIIQALSVWTATALASALLGFLFASYSPENTTGVLRDFFRKKREHPLFEPLSLRSPNRVTSPFRGVFPVFLVPLLFFLPLNSTTDEAHPSAGKPLGSFGSWAVYRNLFQNRGQYALPDASLLLASRVYGETFLYGAVFDIPALGDRVTLDTFDQRDGRVTRDERTVLTFDDEWLRRFEKDELGRGLGVLFASLDGPAPVVLVHKRPKPPPFPFHASTVLLPVLSLITAAVFHGSAPRRRSYARTMFLSRRKTSAA